MPSAIYALIDTLDHFVPADRWMAQTGNFWQAVAPFEDAASWFEDDHLDFAPQLVRPLGDIPTSGTLVWRDESGLREMPAEEAAIILRDIVAPIEAMARAMAEAEGSTCFSIADKWHEFTQAVDDIATGAEPGAALDECTKWMKLASAAWTASRPVPANGANS